LTFGHSSQTCCCVIWNLPGPSCRVTISWRQLQRLVPFAGFITGLLWVSWKSEMTLKREWIEKDLGWFKNLISETI
jgi:hypothetical protein